MTTPLKSIIDAGTKLWLDSIDPELTVTNRQAGATGATSNPIIVGDLIKTGRFDDQIQQMINDGLDDSSIAWAMTDRLVRQAQEVFHPVWVETAGNDGYVSFELDPLLEDVDQGPPHAERVEQYIELGKQWGKGHENRMIKVPATKAGLEAVGPMAAAGLTLNVTLVFTRRQYEAARDAIWKGAQQRPNLDRFKSVYSIFVSRVDVYTDQHLPNLSPAAQGMVGIVNAKQIWRNNADFWASRNCPLQQEMIFASTGTKKPDDPKDKYVAALVGSDIQTNPPAINDAVMATGKTYTRAIDELPPTAVLEEIAASVDEQKLEDTLMAEGLTKFADPQKGLLKLIGDKRAALAT